MIAINNTTKQKIDFKKTRAVAEKFLRVYKKPGREISLAVIGPTAMRRLNREYRGIDKTTDVLSFSAERSDQKNPIKSPKKSAGPLTGHSRYLGEIIININETKKIGQYRDIFAEKEEKINRKKIRPAAVFYFLLVHGLLHLIGYDDETERSRQKMIELGKELLNKIK